MIRVMLLGLGLLAATACGGCTLAAFQVMEEVDHAVSKLAQSDCEIVRLAHFKPICTDPERPPLQPPVYCYRRLGAVDCYASRDPGDAPIVEPPAIVAMPAMAEPITSPPPAPSSPRMLQPMAQKPEMAKPEMADPGDNEAMPPAPGLPRPQHSRDQRPDVMAEQLPARR